MTSHPIYRVKHCEVVAPYTLSLRFDDSLERTINFEPLLAGQLYGPLHDLALFNQVRVDPEVQTVVWPNGADFDPATLHDWPEHADALIACARMGRSAVRFGCGPAALIKFEASIFVASVAEKT